MARQAWNTSVELDRTVLEHARAMLLVLAALVERAAGLPTVERLWFLSIMGCGEAELRSRIVAMAFDAGAPAEAAAPHTAPDSRLWTSTTLTGNAALLAARFRMLALAVDALLTRAGGRSPCPHAAPSISRAGRKPRRTVPQFTLSPAHRATSPPARWRGASASATMIFLRTEHMRAGRYWRFSRPPGRDRRSSPRRRQGDRT